jgi:hypothetical protein
MVPTLMFTSVSGEQQARPPPANPKFRGLRDNAVNRRSYHKHVSDMLESDSQ